ncbi:hypothetical protein At1D1460_51260 (plasmid) [Agrobacterium tumefaciens]|nr:hypothetical protein At1D1460_51260 [Agrobacterium tumefaciens]
MDRFGGKITRHVALLAVALVSIAVVSALFVVNRQGPGRYFDGVARQAAVAIDHGKLDGLKTLVDQGLVIDERGREQMTLLWYAIVGGHYDAVRQLVALGAKPDENGVSPLGSPLHHALTSDTELLKAFLDAGLTLDYQTSSGISLLQRSVFGDGAIDRVRLLVQRGADINHRDKLGGTALDEAIAVRKPEIAIFLVEQGADIDAMMTNGSSTAWAVQWMLSRLQPGSPSGAVTDLTLSERTTSQVEQTQTQVQSESADAARLRSGFERLRDIMIAKGARFPADPPDVMRARMKAQGLPVAE